MRYGSLDNSTATIYTLEVKNSNSEWVVCTTFNFDEEAVDYFASTKERWEKQPLGMEFSASGSCWQKYGILGTLDQYKAEQAAFALARKTCKPVRVVRRTYKVDAEEALFVSVKKSI